MVEVFDYLLDNVKVIGLSGTAGSGKDYVAKTYFINLPKFILYLFHYIDCFLISIFPSIFPWVRRIVIKKK